jgi:NAD(P)H-nitrite reductase large subunit
MAAETYICRCERVTLAAVEAAIGEGNHTINDVKRRTRAGMGICQGIYCTASIAADLINAGGAASEIEPMTYRPPARIMALTVVGRPESET